MFEFNLFPLVCVLISPVVVQSLIDLRRTGKFEESLHRKKRVLILNSHELLYYFCDQFRYHLLGHSHSPIFVVLKRDSLHERIVGTLLLQVLIKEAQGGQCVKNPRLLELVDDPFEKAGCHLKVVDRVFC